MTYTISWLSATGPMRKRVSTATEALRLYNTYIKVSSNMVMKDELGKRVTADDLAKLAAS